MENKFKVWDKKAKRMSPPFALFGEFMLMGGLEDWIEESGIKEGLLTRLNDLEELRFTGLTDKLGEEIYEGDIMQGSYKKYPKIVKYIGACFHLVNVKKVGIRHFALSESSARHLIRVGNIFEHRHLIENK